MEGDEGGIFRSSLLEVFLGKANLQEKTHAEVLF